MTTFVYIVAFLFLALCVVGLFFFKTPPIDREEARAELSLLQDEYKSLCKKREAKQLSSEEFDEELEELERRALLIEKEARHFDLAAIPHRVIFCTVLFLTILSSLSYLILGSPWAADAEFLARHQQRHEMQESSGVNKEKMYQALLKFEANLVKDKKDIEGWVGLAESYAYLGLWRDSVRALDVLNTIEPDNPDTLTNLADALAAAENMNLEGRPSQYIEKALTINPKHTKALSLKATLHFNRGDYKEAIRYWKELLTLLPKDSSDFEAVQNNIREAESLVKK